MPPKKFRNIQPNNNTSTKFLYYCTHGANKSHCSEECVSAMEGHQRDATLKIGRDDLNMNVLSSWSKNKPIRTDGHRILFAIILSL